MTTGDPLFNIKLTDYADDPFVIKVDIPYGDERTAPGSDIFKTFRDAGGRFRTQSLFAEYPHDKYPAFFTLKKKGREGYINLYEKYMEIGDPTEYQVAIRQFGSWDHWQALTRSKWFMTHLTGWRLELKAKMESDRYYEMVRHTTQPNTPQAIQASKWLAERYGGSSDKVSKRGRPTKEEKAAHLAHAERDAEDLKEDAKRIGVV